MPGLALAAPLMLEEGPGTEEATISLDLAGTYLQGRSYCSAMLAVHGPMGLCAQEKWSWCVPQGPVELIFRHARMHIHMYTHALILYACEQQKRQTNGMNTEPMFNRECFRSKHFCVASFKQVVTGKERDARCQPFEL